MPDCTHCLTEKLMVSYCTYEIFLELKAGLVKYTKFQVLQTKS